ncbi:alpha/beta fold hydrolase [Brevibacterium album]|uniref:alpha/beta fold hydrolase n=1 Tax=Brevibacterium album TaxID=417948 RepID=UPI0003F8B2A3|nr:alpha/beta fold hydrolase [Brevibacterium album]
MSALAYSVVNDADPTAPLLILGPSLGTHASQWAGAGYFLADDYRVVLADLPGHGAGPRIEGVTIERIAEGILEIADELGAERFSFAGISISGAVALTLALRAPERLVGVGALCTGASFGGPERWNERIENVRALGSLRPTVPETAARWFAAGFLDEDQAAGAIVLEQLAQTDPEAFIDCCRALGEYDLTGEVADISVPVLFLAGSQDEGNTPESMRALSEQVPGSEFRVIPDSAHLPIVEHPEIVAEVLAGFLARAASR